MSFCHWLGRYLSSPHPCSSIFLGLYMWNLSFTYPWLWWHWICRTRESWDTLWLSPKSQQAIHFVQCVSAWVTDNCGSVPESICQVQTVPSKIVFTPPSNTWFQRVWQEAKMFHFSPVSGKDRVVVREGRQMAWHLWKRLLALMKQADVVWLWPALQWQLGPPCIGSQILLCLDHTSNIRQKEKQWPEITDFGGLTASPWDQFFFFPAKGLGNLWFQKKQLAYSKTQDGAFRKYCALSLPISLSLGAQPPG